MLAGCSENRWMNLPLPGYSRPGHETIVRETRGRRDYIFADVFAVNARSIRIVRPSPRAPWELSLTKKKNHRRDTIKRIRAFPRAYRTRTRINR